MKLILQKDQLLEKIILASRFTSNRLSSITTLQSILLKVESGLIHLYTTNLNSYFHTTIKIEEKGSLEAIIDPKKISEFLSLIPAGRVEIEIDEKVIFFKQGKVKGKFPLIKKEEFPLPPEIKEKEEKMEGGFFEKNLPLILFAAAKDESRPALSGINFSAIDDQLYMVATDGFRLSLIKTKNIINIPSVIIPADFLGELIRLMRGEGSAVFSYSPEEKMVVFKIKENSLYSRLIEGEFPPFEKVIPLEKKTSMIVDKDELLRNTKLVSVFARDNSNIIIWRLNKNELIITPKTEGGEDNSTAQEIQVEGEDQKVAFNYKFILEFLNNCDAKRIIVEILRSDAPVVFKQEGNPDFLHIIMPVRIQE